MITAGMEAGAARLGQGEKIPSRLLFCVSIKRETVASEDFFFFLNPWEFSFDLRNTNWPSLSRLRAK